MNGLVESTSEEKELEALRSLRGLLWENDMPYGIIVLICSFALTAVYVLVTQAPVKAKAAVAALFLAALR